MLTVQSRDNRKSLKLRGYKDMMIIRNCNECGAECGESAILSTKQVESLPLRHCILRHFCLSTGVPFSCQFVCISRRKASSVIEQVSSVILQVRNLIKARFGGKLVVKTAGESLSFLL